MNEAYALVVLIITCKVRIPVFIVSNLIFNNSHLTYVFVNEPESFYFLFHLDH